MGFSKRGYGSGLPFPTPGDLSEPGIKPASLVSPSLAGRFLTSTTWEAQRRDRKVYFSPSYPEKMKVLNLTQITIISTIVDKNPIEERELLS